LDKLVCEGDVHVHQDPSSAEEQGIDMHGRALQLQHYAEGNVLVVMGEADDLALVRFNKMIITGPEVNIDQVANKAWVNGLGSLKMPSESDLNGQKLAKPKDLTIRWHEDMDFNGQCAVFHGDSQAEQEDAHLTCQDLQVFFDRAISLRAGEKGDTPARVKELVCDRKVRVEDTTREGSRLLRYQRLVSAELQFD